MSSHSQHPERVPLRPEWMEKAHIGKDQYRVLYEESIRDPEGFWAKQAGRLKWRAPWQKVKDTSFFSPIKVEWFKGGKLNVAENCLDRHLPQHKDKVAFYFEPDSPEGQTQTITYGELHQRVCRLSNVLKSEGVKKGDRVTIYLPMIPQAIEAMLACARIGAVHSVVFAGFSPDSLSGRIQDCQSEYLITADEGLRGGKRVPLKANADRALSQCPGVKKCFVVQHTGAEVSMQEGRDLWLNELVAKASPDCPAEEMDAEDPLFILYTSGSTSKPKGVLHTSGGYLLYASMSFEMVFDYHPEDIYWCAADVGWVTGHSYMVYGPLATGATSVLFEGVPTSPTPSRLWEVVDKYKVSILYTAPTLIRALMKEGEAPVQKTSRQSLRLLGSVGEPINPEAWWWYSEMGGRGQAPIVDTWWQTETGGIMITPFPGATDLKPGSASWPFFGVEPILLDEQGQEILGAGEGLLCFRDSWPGQMRTVYNEPQRFEETYFSQFKGYYFSGDGARRDEDGYLWISGRVDDVLNVSGHRMGTAEVESALVGHHQVAEAAVVGFPHEIKGQGVYAYVTLVRGVEPSEELKKELVNWVREEIGPIAKPDVIHWAPALPKTRSGKIMRRILRKIAENKLTELGDTSTLAEPAVVEELVALRP